MVPRDRGNDTGEDPLFSERLLISAREIGRTLDTEECSRMTEHYRLLRFWGRRMNLTGLKDTDSILKRHFLEPIAVSDLIDDEGSLLDIGSGNGFPAVPLKVLHPKVELTLVESSEKKAAFLREVVNALRLKGARVVMRRACRRADLVDLLPVRWLTFRGVRLPDLLSDASPDLLDPGGKLLAFLSEADGRKLAEESLPGLRFIESRPLPGSPGDVVAVFGSTR